MLTESINKFVTPVYGRTQRSPETYKTVASYCSTNLVERVSQYHGVTNNQQLLREIRNDIDYYLRRYHEYCIQQRDSMGAHYHEVGAEEFTDFEHLIPAARIRDLLLAGLLTVQQALNAPTVKLSRSKHVMLKDAGWASNTPDMWLPFRRYSQVFAADFTTFDGYKIDPDQWTLQDHYDYFQHLVL